MKKLPITINFDPTKVIGYAYIDDTKLPDSFSYMFSIGYHLTSLAHGGLEEGELRELSLIPDINIYNYLKKKFENE